MTRDATQRYFAGTARDRAAFEVGIKLGSILHQYVGAPVTEASAGSLESAMEHATRAQPFVTHARVRIDRERLRLRGPYRYGVVTEDLLIAEVSVRVDDAHATGALRYVPELDYPLMYLKEIGNSTNP